MKIHELDVKALTGSQRLVETFMALQIEQFHDFACIMCSFYIKWDKFLLLCVYSLIAPRF